MNETIWIPITLITFLALFVLILIGIYVFFKELFDARNIFRKHQDPDTYFRKKGLLKKPDTQAKLGIFIHDPELDLWECNLENQDTYSFYSSNFNDQFADKLYNYSQIERDLFTSKLKEYILKNWDGPSNDIRDISFTSASYGPDENFSVSYNIALREDNLDYGIIINLNKDYIPINHIWFD